MRKSQPHYLPPIGYGDVRLTLTGPEVETLPSSSRFVGEWDGEPVQVSVYNLDVVRVRRALAEHGSLIWDTHPSRVNAYHPPVPEPEVIQSSPDARQAAPMTPEDYRRLWGAQ